MWLEGDLHGSLLRDAGSLLESVKNRLVAQSAMLLTRCGKMQRGESTKQVRGGIFLSNWVAGKDDAASVFGRMSLP